MRLYRNERRHFIGVFFRPPSSGIDVLIEFEKSLALLNRNGIKHRNTVITGDFNLPTLNGMMAPQPDQTTRN